MSRKGAHEGRPYVRLGGGRGWVPAGVFTGVGSTRGDGDGSPHPRGQWEGCGDGEGVNVREGRPRGTPLREVGWGIRMGSCPRLHEGRPTRE